MTELPWTENDENPEPLNPSYPAKSIADLDREFYADAWRAMDEEERHYARMERETNEN